MRSQRYRIGQKFNPEESLIIRGTHLLHVESEYPEIAQVARTQPLWESMRFVIFPVTIVPTRHSLRKVLALAASDDNQLFPLYEPKNKTRLRAVVNLRKEYAAYRSLYTSRILGKRRR